MIINRDISHTAMKCSTDSIPEKSNNKVNRPCIWYASSMSAFCFDSNWRQTGYLCHLFHSVFPLHFLGEISYWSSWFRYKYGTYISVWNDTTFNDKMITIMSFLITYFPSVNRRKTIWILATSTINMIWRTERGSPGFRKLFSILNCGESRSIIYHSNVDQTRTNVGKPQLRLNYLYSKTLIDI